MSTADPAAAPASPSSSASASASASASSSDDAHLPAMQVQSATNASIGSEVKFARLDSNGFRFDPPTATAAMSLSSPLNLPMLTTSPLVPTGSLFSSSFLASSLLPASMSSPLSPSFTPDGLQSLLMSLRATSSPTASVGSMPLVPFQLLPGPLLVLPSSLQSPSGLQRQYSMPHPKLLTFSVSSVMHEDIPSSIPAPPLPAPSTIASGSASISATHVNGSAMELSPYSSPHSPLSPLSASSTDSDDSSGRDSDDNTNKGKHSKHKSRKSLKRPASLSETDNDDTDSTHSVSSSSSSGSSSSSDAHESKKRRCVVSAQKLLTDNSAVDLSLSIVHFHHHSIRIIHTHSASGPAACYVHGADVGGVIERKSNISRMFGQFESPREKVLMNVTGKHNHTVGQEANVLTVAGVERLMTLKKCAPNAEYCDWLRTQLLPRLREGNGESGDRGPVGQAVSEQGQGHGDVMVDTRRVKSETEGEVVNVMASLCTATV